MWLFYLLSLLKEEQHQVIRKQAFVLKVYISTGYLAACMPLAKLFSLLYRKNQNTHFFCKRVYVKKLAHVGLSICMHYYKSQSLF